MSTGANDVAGAAAGGWRDTLEATSRYYLGIPRVKTPDFRIFWSGEQMFKRVLRVGRPVVVSLMVPGEAGCHAFEEQLKLASAEFYKKVIFLQVNCAEAEDFCRSRAPSQLPSVEVFVPVTEVRCLWTMLRLADRDAARTAWPTGG